MKRKRFFLKIAFLAAYAVLLLILSYFQVPCLFQATLGLPCPGCGMTRAIRSLLHFDFAAAFSFHPMVFSLPILFLYLLKDGGLFQKKQWDYVLLGFIGLGFVVHWVSSLVIL